MAEGFFGRWSQRKDATRKGRDVAPEPEQLPAAAPAVPPTAPEAEQAPEPLPTLEEAQALTSDSDFTRFVRPDVPADVKNAALKKLFSDPHFNTMDGLDVYIDDYNKPDPLPASMLKQLASAKFLGLFDEDREKAAGGPEGVAQSDLCKDVPGPDDDADPDLRLQQDDAPGPEGPGPVPR